MRGEKNKVKTLKEILEITRKAKKEGLTIVTTNGCFDLLHVGHIRNLKFTKKLGDLLIVGVNSDKSVKTNKGLSRPIVPEKERAEIIEALESVNYVFIFNEPSQIECFHTTKNC